MASSCSRRGGMKVDFCYQFCDHLVFPFRFYWILFLILFVLLPINAPLEYWDDTVQAAIFVAFSLRYLVVINFAWLVNSAHFIWALDKNHKQSDSNMVFIVTKRWEMSSFNCMITFNLTLDIFNLLLDTIN
jgi:hypothetical protein